jgi:branched-subunit amino acid transport protein
MSMDAQHPAEDAPRSPEAAPAPWWRRALPFVVAAGLIALTLRKVDLRAFAQHVASVNAPAFLGFAALFILALLTADAFATSVVYRRTVAPVRFVDLWILRGAAYLPSLVNHHVGQAFLTYYIARGYGVPLARMAGGTLLVYVSWMGLLAGTGCVAMIAAGQPLLWPGLIVGAGLAYLAVIALRPAFLARTRLLAPLFEAGLGGHLTALAVRVPHLVVLFLGTWLPFPFFGVDIPFLSALAYVPILMVGVTLPITPQGLGTRDLLAVTFFEKFAAGATHEARLAAIAAATTSWVVAITLTEALLGLVLLRRALPALERRAAVTST